MGTGKENLTTEHTEDTEGKLETEKESVWVWECVGSAGRAKLGTEKENLTTEDTEGKLGTEKESVWVCGYVGREKS